MIKKSLILIALCLTVFVGFTQEPAVGEKAPHFTQNLLNGETFNLSDLKGQLVLIDFWASWCGPCRKENPNLIEAYNKYKNANFKNGTGFTIVSVSLDIKKEKWAEAIEKDGMIWPYHVSDLKGWNNSAAKLYKINSVPASYLIDGEGNIIATNLRGDALSKQLKKYKKGLL